VSVSVSVSGLRRLRPPRDPRRRRRLAAPSGSSPAEVPSPRTESVEDSPLTVAESARDSALGVAESG